MVAFTILLLRRIGLAVGAWAVVHYGINLVLYQLFTYKPNGDWFWGVPVPYATGLAWGAAIVAFFLPRPGMGVKAPRDGKEQGH